MSYVEQIVSTHSILLFKGCTAHLIGGEPPLRKFQVRRNALCNHLGNFLVFVSFGRSRDEFEGQASVDPRKKMCFVCFI
jgi:hypothetical protein